jgi:hypothetical protein
LKFFCPSIDSAGHESAETADAVKNVIDRLFMAMDIKVIAATADAGGGGSIDNIRPQLIKLGIMDKNGKFANCSMHSFNKAVEIPIKETMGNEGLGVRSPTQMVFVFSTLMDHLRSKGGKGGREMLNRLWRIVGEEILIKPEWKQYAEDNFPMIWKEFVEKVDKLQLDDNDLDNLYNFLTEAPANIQRPVWTRWQTMILTTDIFLEHYVQIYFLCIAVKTDAKNESYAWKLACTLLSLMNEKAEPTLVENDRENINDYVNSFSNENVEERGGTGDPNFNGGISPPAFHTMLLFFSGFCKYTFTDHFELLKKNDPYFGDGTSGQISRFMSLVAYCVDNDMNQLKIDNGTGWKTKNEFRPYLDAIRNVPAVTTHAANQAFYESLPMIFFNKYHSILDKHFITRWTGGELGIYTIAGDSWLAQELAYALVTYKGYLQNLNKEDSTTLQYSFLDKNVPLDDFFRRKGNVQTVNIKNFMDFFLGRTDMYEILTDDFTVNNWDSIEALAIARDRGNGNTVVRLFDYTSDGDIDRSTWGDYDYEPFIDSIWRVIAIHAMQQQRCENWVQLAALVSKTHVGEKRRTWRAIALTIIRRFNQMTLDFRRSQETDPEKKKKVRRVRGAPRTEGLSDTLDEFISNVAHARESLGPEICKGVMESLQSSSNKASAKESKKMIDRFKKSAKRSTIGSNQAEAASGYDSTALMMGKIVISKLTKRANLEKYLDAEIEERNIQPKNMPDWKTSLPITDKRKLLKMDEAKHYVTHVNQSLSLVDAMPLTTSFIPQSALCKQLLQLMHN